MIKKTIMMSNSELTRAWHMSISLTELNPFTLSSTHAGVDMATDDVSGIRRACAVLRAIWVDHSAKLETAILIHADAVIGEKLVCATASVNSERCGDRCEQGEEGEESFIL
jgi:hypothetical protein